VVPHALRIAPAVLLFVTLSLVTGHFAGGNTAEAAFNDSDGDGTVDIAELLAGSDPHDALSTPESAGGTLYLGRPLCTDGVDNDRDGFTDAADPGCTDSDHDLVDDPIEVQLGSDPQNSNSVPESSMIDAVLISFGFITFQCNDGLDNDLDGLIDMADPGCAVLDSDGDGFGDVVEKPAGSDPNDAASVPEDQTANPGSCSDGADNDLDGVVDSEDAGCAPATPTPRPTATPVSEATVSPAPSSTATPPAGRLPETGDGPGSSGRSEGAHLVSGLAAAGAAAAGALWVVRHRRRA